MHVSELSPKVLIRTENQSLPVVYNFSVGFLRKSVIGVVQMPEVNEKIEKLVTSTRRVLQKIILININFSNEKQ